MSDVLSLTRAARLIGVTRAELQKKIKRGEMISHDGMVTVANLLACYPGAQLEDTAETRRFAPIKSLIEHALSLEVETIHLHWFGSDQQNIYLPNIAHAWQDALDNFHYEEHVAGFDLRTVSGKRADALLKQIGDIVAGDTDLLKCDIYIAGPEDAVHVAEQFFLGKGLPKTRVTVASVK